MKATALSIACVTALGVAGQAMAHGPTVIPDLSIFIAGSSSQQLTLGKIATGLFAAGSIHVYYDTSTAGQNYRAYFGTVTGTGNPLLDGKKVLINNRAKGGSVWGVNPVARAEAISSMDVKGNCVPTANVYPAVPQYNCPTTVNAIPDAGVSDVEPPQFWGPNVAPVDSELTDAERARLSVFGANAVIFGVAVSKAVRDAVVTNLKRGVVTAMLTSNMQLWNEMDSLLPSKPVVVCRRVPGSGTQWLSNNHFGGVPCALGGGVPHARFFASAPPGGGGVTYHESSTSGGVRDCLNKADTGGTLTQPDGTFVTLPPGSMALGMLSIENQPGATDTWSYVSSDGVAPTRFNAACGTSTADYEIWTEQTFQTRNVAICTGSTHVGALAHLAPCHVGETLVAPPSAVLASFIEEFITRSSDPAYLSALPGVAALRVYYTPTAGGEVMESTRFGNNCSSPLPFGPLC